jgi:acyl carrier protein
MSTLKTGWLEFKKLVCDFIDKDRETTRPYSSWEDLGLDSLDYVGLIIFVEEEYDVDFDQAVDDIKSIGGLHGLLVRTLEKQRAAEISHRDTVNTRCSSCGQEVSP